MLKRTAISLLLAAFLTLSWLGTLDDSAQGGAQATLTRALSTWAIARGLNGIISVAQGTEIAIQPVGVGITVTVGEILDPLNDLVERFSWLALLASASLGTQALLTELLSQPWASTVLTVTVVGYLVGLWWPRPFPGREGLQKICMITIFARFLVAAVTFFSSWVDATLLAERQGQAMARISTTSENIEALQQRLPESAEGFMERFGAIVDGTSQALDVQGRLETLKNRVESAIGELVNLMVLFVVQTLILPIGGLWLAFRSFKWFWSWSWRST